jgi:methyl-accepting chemotaxis protein
MLRPNEFFRFKRIGTRLGAGFGVVMVIMLLMAGVAATQLWRIQALNAEAARDAERMSLVQHWSALVRTNLDRALTATRLDGAAGDDLAMRDRLSTVLGRLKEDMAATATATGVLQKQVNALSSEADIATLIAAVNTHRSHFVKVRGQVRDDIQMGDGAKRIDTELVPLASTMLHSLDALEQDLERRSSDANATLASLVARAKTVLFASSAAALLAAALLAWLTAHSITAPMRDAVSIADHIANGDLTMSIATDRPDELGSLLRRLSQMQRRLQTTFGDIRRSADNILTASTEVATGNADLSQRTEQTASSLQQTASSIEQLAGNVNHSAASARDADQLAKSAADVAGRGGAAVGRVITTMDEISASSRQIAEIIGVIDGIAFQTNILALNAAVEAARAGEQGRGFAVVASEVRSLAHRSADAAKQIKVLIDASVERVEQGAKLVGEAGQTMTQLVDGVRRVSDVVGEITARSGRQSEGLGEVNTAVNQIDQMTQQNAALVEQSAAAAESLKDQARSLADALAVFRLQPA